MQRMSKPIVIAACLSQLVLQWGGVHVHADEAGFVGGPETSYTHSHSHDDHAHPGSAGSQRPSEERHTTLSAPASEHDYGDATDVSLLEKAVASVKIPVAMVAPLSPFALLPRVPTLASAEIAYPVLSGRHTRWRPPLRAPPLPASI